jgi:hypothetical protein
MQILQKIQDITNHIKIKSSDFSVYHPNYQPVELPSDVRTQIQKLPQSIQDSYLNSVLQQFINITYFSGSITREKNQVFKTDERILEEINFVDWDFYEQLHKNNQGKGWWNPNFRVLRQEVDGSLAVQRRDITLHIKRERHLQLANQSAAVGDLVSIWMLPSQIKGRFYAAIGDTAGQLTIISEDSPDQAVKVLVYFNFSPEGAVAVMKALTARLNEIKVPFTFYVLHNPSNYGVYNSGILRFERSSYELVRQVLQTIYTDNQFHFQNQVPLFTKMLAPGLALAEEPEHPFKLQVNFEMNRCQIVANALLEAHHKGDESPEARMKYIFKHFDHSGIDIERPYLNPNSEDIYTPLDVNNGLKVNQ